MAQSVWRFYEAPGGGSPVDKDLVAAFGEDKTGRVRLLGLMNRISSGETLPRDVKDLKHGLLEARLTHRGGEYRLFFARVDGGAVLLALHFIGKKGRTVPRAVELARKRLSDWSGRV